MYNNWRGSMSSFYNSDYDPENRFMRCAMEHKMNVRNYSLDIPAPVPTPVPLPVSTPELSYTSIKKDRTLSVSSTNSNGSKYPNSKLRSRTNTISSQDIRVSICEESPKQTVYEEMFPTLNNSPSISTPISPKTPIFPLLSSPISLSSPVLPKKSPRVSGVSLSLQNGKLIQKETYEDVPEEDDIPPLVISPSKWSDLLKKKR